MLIDEAVNIVKDETDYFSEASTEHLKTSLLDVDKFIRVNQLKEITNPVFLMVLHLQKMDCFLMKFLVLLKLRDLVYMLI